MRCTLAANYAFRYHPVKHLGIPGSNIILMLADDAACNPRNQLPLPIRVGCWICTARTSKSTVKGRLEASVAQSERSLLDERSNMLVYLTRHGGNEFLKFQGNEVISAFDIADAFEQMCHEIFMIDICQTNTLYSKLYSPNILATGSSDLGENSYSYENDDEIGFDLYDLSITKLTAGVRSDLFTTRSAAQTLITDFFGGVAQVEVLEEEAMAGLGVDEENRVHTEGVTILPDSSQPARSPSHSRGLQEQPEGGYLLFPSDPVSTSRSSSSDPGTGGGIDIGSEPRAASALHQPRPLGHGFSQQQRRLLNDAMIITSRDGAVLISCTHDVLSSGSFSSSPIPRPSATFDHSSESSGSLVNLEV
ncbi:hypothetical protein BS47DRAFT_1389763 [Hydnum rufescens UP504]|uniref:Uncharacterized protein n=1 Tax=Hydnum rufescens UP504 TaxID=1448309 RepID=A0A9P6DWI0_9AGAM|nr:hypothetical protein BS47DRAFT_1389763 [Hydnum rufescens UP504]